MLLSNTTYPYCAMLARLLSELVGCFNEVLPKTALVSPTVTFRLLAYCILKPLYCIPVCIYSRIIMWLLGSLRDFTRNLVSLLVSPQSHSTHSHSLQAPVVQREDNATPMEGNESWWHARLRAGWSKRRQFPAGFTIVTRTNKLGTALKITQLWTGN